MALDMAQSDWREGEGRLTLPALILVGIIPRFCLYCSMTPLRFLGDRLRLLLVVLAAAAGLWAFHTFAPPQHNPWRPLSLSDPIGLATYDKLTGLKHKPSKCFAALDAAAVAHTQVENSVTGAGCGFENALLTRQVLTPLNDEMSMSCPLAASLYIWEQSVARPLAEDMFGSPLARLETYGTYSCRNIAGSRQRSEHAMANAIDIAAFRLADGRLISVAQDWDARSPEGRYLKRVHKAACKLFSVTLGPDYNAAHADHFHLDFGSGSSCR